MAFVALENVGRRAASLLGMPGPWSLNEMVWPLSMIEMVGSMKEAWM